MPSLDIPPRMVLDYRNAHADPDVKVEKTAN
jgi:hypothetical protein